MDDTLYVATRSRQNSHPEEVDDDVLLMNADFESSVLAEARKKAILLDRIKRTPKRGSDNVPVDSSDVDVRSQLFGQIPEPYLHVTTFQRVLITESGDPVDKDTTDACGKLEVTKCTITYDYKACFVDIVTVLRFSTEMSQPSR
jgi:hypothetical protein